MKPLDQRVDLGHPELFSQPPEQVVVPKMKREELRRKRQREKIEARKAKENSK